MAVQRTPLVLGLDPGTQLGWAVCATRESIIASGVESFAAAADRSYGAAFAALRRFLNEQRRALGPFAAVAYELPFLRGPLTTRLLWGMAAHVQERCAVWRCRPLAVNTMTLKKFATGSGKADKAAMIRAAQCLTTVHVPGTIAEIFQRETLVKKKSLIAIHLMSEHEADAIHVARWGWEQLVDGDVS